MLSERLSEREKAVAEWYDENGEMWAEQRKKLSEPSFWHEEYALFAQLRPTRGALLEIGSGSGREAREWIQMGYEYTGIDLSPVLIAIAKQTEPAGHYVHTSIYAMPFPPLTFDAFSSWALLPHIPKERMGVALDKIHAVLKPNALGFIAVREGVGEKQEPQTGRWFSYYLGDEFTALLKEHGFELLQAGRKVSRADLTWLTFYVQKVMI